MSSTVTLDSVFLLAKQLPLAEKVRLIEWIAPQIERELLLSQRGSRKSLRGLWRGLGITDGDIEEARCEMWAGFPREDI